MPHNRHSEDEKIVHLGITWLFTKQHDGCFVHITGYQSWKSE